jgi:hypothetical protein
VQLSWFQGWVPEKELAIALQANPVVEWYMRHKCPDLNAWLDRVKRLVPKESAGRNYHRYSLSRRICRCDHGRACIRR